MQKFNHACLIEDYEWNNNRNEDDPAFDDFAWWDAVDAKIKADLSSRACSPRRVLRSLNGFHDELMSRKIREYYEAHPEEREALH